MIKVRDLTKLYGTFAAVQGLDLEVQPGQLMGLVGPNGAGKTTTLRCLAGIIPPTRGSIHIANTDLLSDPVQAKQQLAFLPDEPRLFDHLTLRQHLEFVARLYQVEDGNTHAAQLLESLGLTGKADELPEALSRGMKQKAALACALLHRPKVVLFDEPLTGLDPLAIRHTKDTILQLARDGAAIILSSHLLPLLEELCTHVLIVSQGRRVAYGSMEAVRRQFSTGDGSSSLEDVFLRIATAPPAPESWL